MATISREELRQLVAPELPAGAPVVDVIDALVAALAQPEARTLPVSRSVTRRGVLCAWRVDDGEVVKLAVTMFGRLWTSWNAGKMMGADALVFVGWAVPEVVFFLMKVARRRADVDDPACVAVLLELRQAPKRGWTADAIWDRFKPREGVARPAGIPNSKVEIERALDRMLAWPAPGGQVKLVEKDPPWWRSLV